MKRILFVLALSILLYSCSNKPTEVILLGTVHQPVKNFNADSLYNILVDIKPDLILFEVDSSFFTPNFQFNKTWNSNENVATVKYMNNFDVDVRPYDFTGRNQYRKDIGSRPTDSKTLKLLDSLYKNSALNNKDKTTYQEFLTISDSLNTFAYLGARGFNNSKTDSVAQIRQTFQYKKLLDVVNNYPIFSNTFYKITVNDSISYTEGYTRASRFWDLRNKTMAKHILHFIKENKGSRIVVLNGYFHRYYLNALIKPHQEKHDFIIKEFYEY